MKTPAKILALEALVCNVKCHSRAVLCCFLHISVTVGAGGSGLRGSGTKPGAPGSKPGTCWEEEVLSLAEQLFFFLLGKEALLNRDGFICIVTSLL